MSHLSVFRIFWNHFFMQVFPINMRYLAMSKKKNPLFVWGWDRKTRPSRLPFAITRRTSWCQSVIIGTDFSIPPLHSWWILIILPTGKCCMLLCRLPIIFKINLSEKIFQEYHQSVKQFGSRSGPTFCRARSGSKLFAKIISRRH